MNAKERTYITSHKKEIDTKNHIKERFNELKNKKIGMLEFEKSSKKYMLLWSRPSNSMKITYNQELIKELHEVNIGNAIEFIKTL